LSSLETLMAPFTILVVEDNPTMQKLVAFVAQRRGLDVVVADTAAEAVSLASAQNFAIVFMDWSLPDGTGLECAREMRKRENGSDKHVPIVAMTGHLMPGDKEECFSHGMDDFMGKPFTLAEFNAMLDRWLPAPVAENIINLNPPLPPNDQGRAGNM
jgi:CheY-like chemotaxis protein